MAKVTTDDAAIDALFRKLAEGGIRSVLGVGEQILKEDILNRPGTGKVYRTGGVTHQASAPGEPPAPDTNNLRTNTNADPEIKADGEDMVGQFSADATYAEAIEVGTEKMAARPFFGLLNTDYRERLDQAFKDGAVE